mmetsp:Transcript_134/g.317  ORF Transcript_134/g.317 Transcript_134/m.317 type:complete len:90 (+) Transcript_134:418-687(+)
MEKVDVNGPNAHPLFTYLKNTTKAGFPLEVIKWNFTKFLIDHEGTPVHRAEPKTESSSLAPLIEELLAKASGSAPAPAPASGEKPAGSL